MEEEDDVQSLGISSPLSIDAEDDSGGKISATSHEY
jgi:hypothetical protein